MVGQWFYREERDKWCLFVSGRQEITISGDALIETCARNGITKRQALEWIAGRPTAPWTRRAA